MLDAIGLDDEQSAVYRLLLSTPSATIDEIAAAASMPTAHVRAVVDDLERLGLLARQASAPDRVVASPPSLALRPMLLERERRLTEAHEMLAQLSELYREGALRREVPDVIDVVLGPDAVVQRLGQLQAAAVQRVDVFVLREVALVGGDENIEEDRALARGVAYRVVVEAGVVERPGFLDQARSVMPLGEEIRVLPTLPTRLFIADGELALLPMWSHGDQKVSGALLVHPSSLLDLVNAMFESSWRSATRLVETGSLAADDEAVDRELVKLVMLGLTDAAAGAQLGISARTVQRRLADLMEATGVLTRLQLAAEAVRRGWV
ncbi:helix-turn-helix domain-containing protein [Agromyces humatus]|uniref:Helix-turn-helix domain-containing protein n=1 Tax=Agromyces humatus TaxID=279573 RepID=A0ABP4WSU8_9MICO|nr:helix-turn-helix domain-containing protein [Agromyces humatus]